MNIIVIPKGHSYNESAYPVGGSWSHLGVSRLTSCGLIECLEAWTRRSVQQIHFRAVTNQWRKSCLHTVPNSSPHTGWAFWCISYTTSFNRLVADSVNHRCSTVYQEVDELSACPFEDRSCWWYSLIMTGEDRVKITVRVPIAEVYSTLFT